MATVEQDPTDGPAPGSPWEGADEGTFRWPSGGVPTLFGRHVADESEQDLAPPAGAPDRPGGMIVGGASAQEPPEPGPAAPEPGPEPDLEPGVEPGLESGSPSPAGQGPEAGPLAPEGGSPVAGFPAVADPAVADPAAAYPADMRVPPFPPGPPAWHEAGTTQALTVDFLMPGRSVAPPSGWRHLLYRATAGRVTARPPAAQRRRHELVRRARTPIAGGHHRLAVLSMKGGVGKTTTVMGLGSTLASLRGDRVIALDANPDRGTLSDKLRLETAATVRDLVSERDQIHRYADVRAYTTQAASRLEVLASDRDPAVSVAFSAEDYAAAVSVLERYYSICLTDCGTGLLHSAMGGVLRLADQIIVVSTPSVDGARSASATLDWLCAHGYGGLVRDGIVALSMVHRRSRSMVDIGRLEEHFAARCRAVVRIPYDANLEEGAEVEIAHLDSATADAYLTLAAVVGDGFAHFRDVGPPRTTG